MLIILKNFLAGYLSNLKIIFPFQGQKIANNLNL